MSRRMLRSGYKPTTPQPAFSALFRLADTHQRYRSSRKLATSFGQPLAALEKPPPFGRLRHGAPNMLGPAHPATRRHKASVDSRAQMGWM